MKIVPFPGGEPGDAAVIAELEAALAGTDGPGAEAWRELSSDIRSMAPPIDREFERALRLRLAAPADAGAQTDSRRAAPASRARRWWSELALAPRLLSLGGAGALAALVIAILIVGPLAGSSSRSPVSAASPASVQSSAGGVERMKGLTREPAGSTPATAAGVLAPSPSPAPGASPERVQQLGAALTLAGSPEEVQTLADGVSRIVIAEGGFVASSQVQVEKGATNDATLVVSVPSGRLSRTLAALGRLGPVRAETQSLQDITSSYDSARRTLQDAVAERAALLRALAHATTQGEIESLHQRLGLAAGAIDRARSAFAQVSSQAANANLEVTVLGEAHPVGGGLSVARGLHDAGRVLTVALAAMLIGLAALLPLLLVGLAVALTLRALRRAARERALGGG